jgi:hypothetical protein
MILRTSIVLLAAFSGLQAQPMDPRPSRYPAPKASDEAALATWATPVAGLNVRPAYFSSSEYCRAPIDNLRTYPVYHPNREPAGYWAALRKKRPEPLMEWDKRRTKAEWIAAGKGVWEELDVPNFSLRGRVDCTRAIARSFQGFEAVRPSRWNYLWLLLGSHL